MNEVMWREVMGFRNMPEQRCLLQGVLNPWHAGFPLWVPGLLAGPSAGARGWLSFRRGSRRARSSGDQCVLNDAGEAACTSESLGSSRWWWWWGLRIPAAPRGRALITGVGRRGAGGLCWFLHCRPTRKVHLDYFGREGDSWCLAPWVTPQRYPTTLCSQLLPVVH